MPQKNIALLLFQAGPVQDFIATARSTRDLWSGSFLLAWLTMVAAREVLKKAAQAEFVFPRVEELGVWAAQDGISPVDISFELTPSMPNRFLAIVPADCTENLAKNAERAFRDELKAIADACFSVGVKVDGRQISFDKGWRERWNKQVELLPEITWQTFPCDGGYEKAYHACQSLLAARRNTRDFQAFVTDGSQNGALKDALTGKEEVIGDEAFWKRFQGGGEEFDRNRQNAASFKKNEGPYGAISMIKRTWHEAYLFEKKYNPRHVRKEDFYEKGAGYLSTPEIAEKNRNGRKNPYVAVIAMDGDQMGKWMDGERRLSCGSDLQEHQKEFSKRLANFSQKCGEIVKNFNGQLIYAGGDDVLAIVPATEALDCARKLRETFKDCVGNDAEGVPADVSCGIAVAHKKYPLQSMVREAHKAEHRAKEDYERGAFAFSLLKRGGETVWWGGKWDEGGACDLFKKYCDTRSDSTREYGGNFYISSRFPYALAGYLAPYALEKFGDITHGLNAAELLKAELKTVVERQTLHASTDEGKKFFEACEKYAEDVVAKKRCGDFVKLFLTAAFIYRERGENEN